VLLSAAGGILAWRLRGEGETFPICDLCHLPDQE
jgi:hypothetical protein